MYKAIISDLDGTLFNNRHQVSDLTRSTLRTLVDGGVRFMVASGRHLIDLQGIRDTLGFDCGLISANGALVSDAEDTMLFHHTLPSGLAKDLIHNSYHDLQSVNIHVFRHDGWYVARGMPDWLKFHQESGFSYTVAKLAGLNMNEIHKIYFTGEHSELLELEHKLLSRYPGEANVVFSQPDCLEVMAAHVSKGAAVKETLEADGLSLNDVIAFGDAMNDFEMLSMVGRGYVMENATPTLKAALPNHPRAAHCDEDGVARRLIEIFGL